MYCDAALLPEDSEQAEIQLIPGSSYYNVHFGSSGRLLLSESK